MKYALIATTNYLLFVDLERKNVVPLEGKRTEYYGISWFSGSEELVLSHSGVNNADLVDIASYAQSEVGWISAGSRSSKRFLSQPHQICCAPDGRVICTNTGRNVISVIDLEKPGLYQEAGLGEARWDRLSLDMATGDHLNSVFLQGDRLYVVAHRFNKGSLLGTFSYPDLGLLKVESLGERTGLHNIWITSEGQRISCHSETGSIVDLDVHTPLWEAGAPIYTRGLAACEDFIVVGESQKSGRDLRHSSLSGLWILDRLTWKAIDYICLGPYGAVNEVRLLDVYDEAHQSKPFSGLARLFCQDMRTQVANDRLIAARAVYEERHLWSDYAMIFGSPESLANGMRRAGQDNLCLAAKKPQVAVETLSFDFELDEKMGVSHVSAVLDYKGTGGDTDMVTLLLQPVDSSSAVLSIWRHDSKEWKCLPDVAVGNLPLVGNLRVLVSDAEVVLMINNREIQRFANTMLGLQGAGFSMGMRWIGASVKPVDSARA